MIYITATGPASVFFSKVVSVLGDEIVDPMSNSSCLLGIRTSSNSRRASGGEALEEVETSTYLGSIIDKQGGSHADLNARIGKTNATFLMLKNIWNSKQLSASIKVRIFNTDMKTVLL